MAASMAGANNVRSKLPLLEQDEDGYWEVSFSLLTSFLFGKQHFDPDPLLMAQRRDTAFMFPGDFPQVEIPTEPGTSGPIPDRIQVLSGERIRLQGYMLPTKLVDGLVKECLVLPDLSMCCFGGQPELNGWVVVKMEGDGILPQMDTPMNFYGRFHVGEMFNNEVFEGIYELRCEKAENG
jgi:hypothetical protein